MLAFVRDAARSTRARSSRIRAWPHQELLGRLEQRQHALLDGMHYRGLLRVARREGGIASTRRPSIRQPTTRRAARRARRRADRPLVRKYAPLPAASLGYLTYLLGYGAPHSQQSAGRAGRARATATCRIDGTDWFWPADENPCSRACARRAVRLLAPFDPVVWDRRRFELFGAGRTSSRPTRRRQSAARLLRPAAAVARPRHRLGQRLGAKRSACSCRPGFADDTVRDEAFKRELADETRTDEGVPRPLSVLRQRARLGAGSGGRAHR